MLQNQFLNWLRHNKRYSEHTLTAYQNDLIQFFEYSQEYYEVSDPLLIQDVFVRDWMMSLVESGSSNTTINRKIACLKSFYNYLRKNDLLKKSPLAQIKSLKKPKRLPKFVAKDQFIELFDLADVGNDYVQVRNHLIIYLLYACGLRSSELMNLEIQHIDFQRRIIKVLGKGNKHREIPITKQLVDGIAAYLKIRKTFNEEQTTTGYLLLTNKGKKLYHSLVYRVVNAYLSSADVAQKSPHVLRHSFATHLLNEGADINAIKELLGHENLGATQVYTHNTIEQLKSIYKQAHPRAKNRRSI